MAKHRTLYMSSGSEFEEVLVATDYSLVKNKPSNYPPTVHDHPISEVTGLQGALDGKAASTHNHSISQVTGLQGALDAKAASANVYTKGEVDAKIVSVYRHIGSTPTLASLASVAPSPAVGDVWNLEDTGMNVVWNGSEWDNLGSVVDLTPYAKTVKVGASSYNSSSGTVSLPAYPTTLPASDVSSWAKAATKPTYNQDEVGDGATYKRVTQSEKNTWNAKSDSGHTHSSYLTSVPTASASVLGVIKVGDRLTITSGVLSANSQTDNNFTTTLKNKLDGIAAGATNVTKSTVTGWGFTENAGTVTGTGVASRLVYWTGTNSIASLNPTTYPSLTELSYVKGVSSAIQTQLNGKAASTHNHSISQVTGLQGALDGKSASGHGHAASEITESTTRRFVSDSDKNKWNSGLNEFIGAHAGVANGTKGLVPAPAEAQAGAFLRGDGNWTNVTPSLIGASDSGHAHSTYDRASSTLSDASVFSNIVVTDGIVTSISTRSLTAANIGALATGGTASNSTKWSNKQLRVGSYTSGASGYITMGY